MKKKRKERNGMRKRKKKKEDQTKMENKKNKKNEEKKKKTNVEKPQREMCSSPRGVAPVASAILIARFFNSPCTLYA